MEPLAFPSGAPPDSRFPEECALDPYVYQPLAPRQIRLFALLPAQDSSAISIRLIHADLPPTSNPEYQALSYAWGTSPARHPVRVLSDRDAPLSVIHVGDSLAGLLLRLRETESEKLLWIDAVCINQTDNAEKSDQIPLMGDIYRLASRVIVWLGLGSGDDASIMEFAQRHGPEMQFDWTSTAILTAPDLARRALDSQDLLLAARTLLSREWFERLWVRQEIALATQAAVFCGSFELEWDDFRAAMMLAIAYNRHDMQELLARVRSFFVPKKMSWPTVRAELLSIKCSDPRDRVYGLLALIKDDRIGSLAVDYSLSTAEVYTLTAKHCLRNITAHNNILLVCELSSGRIANLPSWAPDWSTDPESPPIGDGLMRASGETRPFIEFPEGGVMRLAGVLSSRVKTVLSLGQTPDDLTAGVIRALGMLASANNAYTGGQTTVGEALICALLKGKYKHTKRPPQPFELTEDEARGALRYFVALSESGNANEQDTENYNALLRHLRTLKWPRVSSNNAIVLFEDGLIGVAPGVATPGDRLFFPLGSEAPLLVRRAVGSPAPRWLVVCAAWVNGRMLGEVLYGPLPPNYGGVRVRRDDGSMITDVKIERFRDDPGDDSADGAWSPRERPRRFGVDNEEDLTPEILASQGVAVEWLDFV